MLEKVKSLYKVVLFCITLFFSPLVSACISGIEAVEANITLAITMASTMVEFILYYRAPQSATNDKKFRRRQANSWLMNLKMDLSNSFSVEAIDQLNLPLIFMMKRVRNAFERVGIIGSNPRYIILTGMPSVTQVIIATLNHEPEAYDKKGNWALGIINACSGNPLIVILPGVITAYLATLALFTTAEANMSSGLHTAKEIRDKKWIDVKHNILALMAVAQLNSNNLPLSGIEIIESGHFKVKMVGAHEVHPFKALNAGPGTMNVSDAGAGDAAVHDWELSIDGLHWTAYLTTRHAKMTATGLPLTTKVWFRTRARVEGMPIPEWDLIYVTVN